MIADSPPSSDTIIRLGRALGPAFEVLRLLGRGGFAEVYEVRDRELGRRLAVKILRPDLPWGPRTVARFLQEARTLAKLSHPHILPIYFVGEADGLVYYAMPFLDGVTLAETLRREGPVGVARALAVVTPILDALSHAHELGIVHRDVKPDNIVIEARTGRPLLVDFGIARSLDGTGNLTESGFVVGTPLYMSPEQALGRPDVDPRADLYAVGAVLFEMLTGGPPFTGSDSQEIVGYHLTHPVPVARISRDDVPLWLRGIVVRCMAKRPEERYPSAAALLEALRDRELPAGVSLDPSVALPMGAVPGSAVAAATVRMPRAAPSRRGRRTVAAALGIALCVVAAAVAAFAYFPEPMLVAENRLAEPVALTVADQDLMLEPGDQVRVPLPRRRRVEAHWALVRPTTRDGRLLGESVEGMFVTARANGDWHTVITATQPDRRWMSPLIVNQSPHAIRVSVISAGDSVDCDCYIARGDSLAVGYYPLSAGGAVRVTDVMGRTTRYAGFDTLASAESGQARLVVDSVTMSAAARKGAAIQPGPTGAAARRRDAARTESKEPS